VAVPDPLTDTADRRHLVIPVFNILSPCLPSSIRRRLHCGVEYDSNDADSDDRLTCCSIGDDCLTCAQVSRGLKFVNDNEIIKLLNVCRGHLASLDCKKISRCRD